MMDDDGAPLLPSIFFSLFSFVDSSILFTCTYLLFLYLFSLFFFIALIPIIHHIHHPFLKLLIIL